MKGATNTKKFFNIWQKTTEERKQLVDQDRRKVSYHSQSTPSTPSFRNAVLSMTSRQQDGNVSTVNSKNANTSSTMINNRNTNANASRTPSSQRPSAASLLTGSTAENTSDAFDESTLSTLRSQTEYNNPVYNWVNESPVVSVRSDNHPSNNTHAGPDSFKVEFNKLPFASYVSRCRKDKWRSAILQAVAVTLAISLIPFIVMVIILLVVKTRFRPKMSRVDKRKETIGLSVLIVVALLRDLMIVLIVVSQTLDSHLSIFRAAYPLFLFMWPLTFCCLPAATFYFADCQYEFGLNPVKRVCSQLASQFNLIKVLPAGNVDIQGMYLSKHYPMVSSISGFSDEYAYLKSTTSKLLSRLGIVVAVTASLIRVVPLLLEMIMLPPLYHQAEVKGNNMSLNKSPWKPDKYLVPYISLIILPSIIFFLVCFFFSLWVLYVVAWKLAAWREWRSFNSNESDDDTTLLNQGPQSTASWWKIRQTLILYSDSCICATSLLGKTLYVTSSLVSLGLSVASVVVTMKKNADVYVTTLASLMLENILIYTVSLILYLFHYLIEKERRVSWRHLDCKKVNIGYEIACMMNLDQEFIDRDPTIRNRLRLLRGRLLLMQEMLSSVKLVDDYSSNTTSVRIAFFVVSSFFVASTVYSAKFCTTNI